MIDNLYERLSIWGRDEKRGTAYCYNVLKRLSDGHYAVQSKDFFKAAVTKEEIDTLSQQFIELFLEMDIAERTSFHESILAAIDNFELDFN